MCIRDRQFLARADARQVEPRARPALEDEALLAVPVQDGVCLLYTSDAADERSSVDLGGRRIIKKKKSNITSAGRH